MTPERPVILLPPKPNGHTIMVARRLASELSCPIQRRRGRTVSGVFRDGHDAVIAVSIEHISYYIAPGEDPFRYHPGMAKNRIGGLRRGDPDTLVRAADLEPGSTILDATLGKATDALVAAHVVGGEGRVVGIEAHPIVATIVRLGLELAEAPTNAIGEAMGRIEVRQGRHLECLRAEADDGFDVVYFDPFFEEQVEGSVDISPLRRIGRHDAISDEAIAEAKRVARRRVVHKTRIDHDPPSSVADWQLVRGKRRIGYRVWSKP